MLIVYLATNHDKNDLTPSAEINIEIKPFKIRRIFRKYICFIFLCRTKSLIDHCHILLSCFRNQKALRNALVEPKQMRVKNFISKLLLVTCVCVVWSQGRRSTDCSEMTYCPLTCEL